MAYYNGFPATYQQMYPQYQQPMPQQMPAQQPTQQQVNGGVAVVQIQGGEAMAKTYLVAPNTTVQLWDVEEQAIYIKSADASGMPSMKILDYTVRGDAKVQDAKPPRTEYATRDEMNALAEDVRELRDEIRGRRRSRLTKEDESDE